MAVLFSKTGQLYGKRRLPDIRQTLIGPGPLINAHYPTIPEIDTPAVDHQRKLPSQNPADGVSTASWPFGEMTI